MHCHCTVNLTGAITISYSNVAADYVDLGNFLFGDGLTNYEHNLIISASPRTEYLLTSGDDDLSSRSMRLNGELLSMGSSLDGKEASGSLVLPPTSYGFVVFPDAAARACS